MGAQKLSAAQKLARIKSIFDTRRKIKGSLRSWVSTHAADNLDGAIISIGYAEGKCDKVSMQTLKRVRDQLVRIGIILEVRP